MGDGPLASIDIGTNTFRLLIGEVHQGPDGYTIREIHSERVITRLGEGVSGGNILTDEGIRQGIKTLKDFSRAIREHNVSSVLAIGTSALREAENRDTFIRKAEEEAGIEVEIATEEEEARLTASGMTMDIPLSGPALLIDIGGGSTEFIFMDDGRISCIKSIKLGVIYMTDRFMRHDPPTESELKGMEGEVMRRLEETKEVRQLTTGGSMLVGTAGTITTLSAMLQGLDSHSHERIHKSTLFIDSINKIYNEIAVLSMKERAEIYPVLLDRRMDIIVPGVLILKSIMATFGFKEIIVSDYGLREGIIIELFKRVRGWS
jgi:exopolyphosphatase/guanosine-5'-triphosphate,3'-diphosphate pyrophosphatase